MQQNELLEIIKSGFQKWNEYKAQAQDVKIDLSGLSLACMNLQNYDFSNCILINTDFQKCHLGKANFKNVIARESNFRKAYFNESDFENADLRDSSFKATVIRNSIFKNSLINRADFSGSNLKNSIFICANIRDSLFCSTRLDNINMIKVHFERSLFREAKFLNSEMALVKLNDSRILHTDFSNCNFENSMLYDSVFDFCQFKDCNLTKTRFTEGRLNNSKIDDTIMRGVNFRNTQLSSDVFTNCDLSNSKIFGISAWRLSLINSLQENLRISDVNEPVITIDNIEVAQFIYLLINNEKLRDVINTVTSKVVLILGRFTADRVKVLNLLREELRHKNYLPILFDFEKSPNRDLTETIMTLASFSKFVIADITDPKSIPQELTQIIPHMTSLPVQPIILTGHSEYGMFEHFKKYPWVLNLLEYSDDIDLRATVLDRIISSCENKVVELRK